MKWSELPKEYQDLEKHFSIDCGVVKESDHVDSRFHWFVTPQGEEFWYRCLIAITVEDLPPIIKTHHEN